MKIDYREENGELKTIDINFLHMVKIFVLVSLVGTIFLWLIIMVIFLIIGIFAGIGSLMLL